MWHYGDDDSDYGEFHFTELFVIVIPAFVRKAELQMCLQVNKRLDVE